MAESFDDIEALKKRIAFLENENRRLKELLSANGMSFETLPDPKSLTGVSPSLDKRSKELVAERLALFTEYFRGRTDVYARKWISRDGKKKGYTPVVKPRFKVWNSQKQRYDVVSHGQTDIYEHLTDNVLMKHLATKSDTSAVIGLYPMVDTDECYLSAMDFDGTSWQQDVSAVMQVCKEHGLPCLLERSQSGNGGHLWFFFKDRIKARKARSMCSSILSFAMGFHAGLSMSSYDRLFPSQDVVTQDGLGNLIALPLQGFARQKGNSVFIAEDFSTLPNQWSALRDTRKLSEDEVDDFLSHAMERGCHDVGKMNDQVLEQPAAMESPGKKSVSGGGTIIIRLKDRIYIPYSEMDASLMNKLKRLASFHNPEFHKAERMRLPTWNKPRVVCCAEKDESHLIIPRGCLSSVRELFRVHRVTVHIQDERSVGTVCDLTFSGTLKPEQHKAVEALYASDQGVLSAPAGFGKTVVGSALIARARTSVLIIVHTKTLLEQWKNRLGRFIHHEGEPMIPGILGGGKDTLTGIVDVAIINSLARKGSGIDFDRYGMVICDECHHIPAVTYEQTVRRISSSRIYGLTATPMRNDGHHAIIFMQCGKLVYQADVLPVSKGKSFIGQVIPKFSRFRCDYSVKDIQVLYEALVHDEARNKKIVADIKTYASQGKSILVLSSRIEHLEILDAILRESAITSIVLWGKQSTRKKKEMMEQLAQAGASDSPVLILSTGQFIGEGFDFPKLDTLFLASPIAWKGNVIQYAGRINREYEGKNSVQVIDYVDFKIPVLERMFRKRIAAYRHIGYSLIYDESKPREKIMYGRNDFWKRLQEDCKAYPGDIVFSVPHVALPKVRLYSSFLSALSESGRSYL
ncbi:DEAD/DEAH box helicase [Parasphaerochaeta coccoides]|uniref:DEAD/DEAH box helicase n=1 Tax=Parasphaerochaeta coccoides TaxID=273376 RepID=UPI00030922CE|nr:DEAD/DEAH box helicase [Parasphaerochaeta coccoides]